MSFLRNTWYVAATSEEVSREPMGRQLLNEKVALFRTEAGEAKAIGNLCPHRFASLSGGKLVGDTLECPYHGLRFDTEGTCVFNPHGEGVIPPRATVKAYPVVEKYKAIWIWMGDEDKLDVDLIPDFSDCARADWRYIDGYLSVEGNYQLIVDNLLDLSHIQFLHPFLSTPEWVEKLRSVPKTEGETVRVINRVQDLALFPVFKQISPEIEDRGEVWMDLRWNAPSHVHIDIRCKTPTVEQFAPNAHFITPESEDSTHYFFRVGRNLNVDDKQLSAIMKEKVTHAFSQEDEPMILDQQGNLGDVDLLDARPIILESDAGAVMARRVLKKMIREEQEVAESK